VKKNTQEINFSKSLVRLEEIVAKLEQPDLDLDEGLRLLEEGVKLHKNCKQKLTEASAKISTILKDDNNPS
jgi:exodeoxyribonuclease VII small subunit